MRVYETTFIINPQVDDATIDQQVAAVSEIITKAGGKILHEQRVGTRRMAYAINGIAQGYYTSLYHEAPTEALDGLNRHFRLGELYLRDLTIRFEGDIEKVAEQQSVSDSFGRRRPGDRDQDRPSRPDRRPERDRDSRPGRDARPQRPPFASPSAPRPDTKPVTEQSDKAPVAGEAAAPTDTQKPAIPPKPESAPAAPEKPVVEEAKSPAEAPKIEPKSTDTPAPAADVKPTTSEAPAPESYDEEDEL